MGLADTQDIALSRLHDLVVFGNTGIREVFTEPIEAVTVLPCLIVFDEAFLPVRFGHWQEIEWRLRLQIFVQAGSLSAATAEARRLRGNLIDRLDADITLGGAVSRTTWGAEGLRLTGLEYPPGQQYAGVDGTYTLWLKEGKTFG